MPKPCTLATETASRVLKAKVRALRREIEPCRSEDPDGIHDLRVASRRIRAVLTAHRRLFERPAYDNYQRHVQRITRALGKARELDVCLGLLEGRRNRLRGAPRSAATSAVRWLAAARKAESASIAQAVALAGGPAFDELLMALFEGMKRTKRCYLDDAAKALRNRYRRLREADRAWRNAASEESLHGIRIQFKKLRYACETFAGLYGADMGRFIARCKELQQVLGDWNDLRVLRNHVVAASYEAPAPAAAGFPALREALEREIEGELTLYVGGADAFFAPANEKQAYACFAHPTTPCCRTRSAAK
ncbi:MAG: CHAD domain-containing protein [Candidatus Hydrogenedentes bacterium]|nr:CHAD domain-containing protein [Candidatus Hydrogenedentota bacterium]